MTIYYPDVSNIGNAGLTIQPNTVAVCAKASEGTTFKDPSYQDFKNQSTKVGAYFFAYHWIHQNSSKANQAANYFSVAGNTPCMIDCENVTSGDHPGVQECIDFANALRAIGGVCTLAYLPKWYWQNYLGSPDLQPLEANGIYLVSSHYTTYSDSGPGWDPYGGVTPKIWQYTNALPYGGQAVDFNAFKGTIEELKTLVNGSNHFPDSPLAPKENNMLGWLSVDDPHVTEPKFRFCNGMHQRDITASEATSIAYGNAIAPDGAKYLVTGDDRIMGNTQNYWVDMGWGYGAVVRVDDRHDNYAGIPTTTENSISVSGTLSGTLNVS